MRGFVKLLFIACASERISISYLVRGFKAAKKHFSRVRRECLIGLVGKLMPYQNAAIIIDPAKSDLAGIYHCS
jgi:hypothetical protein